MKKILILLMLSASASAGLPPTSSKGAGDTNPVTTFQTDYGTIPLVHTGTKAVIGTIPLTAGGTGKTTQQNTSDLLIPRNTGLSPQTTLSDEIDHVWSAAVTGGGNITNNGDGTVSITQANTVIRDSHAITLLTQSAGVATATISDTSSITNGERVTIRGAAEVSYNGTFSMTVISPTQFTFPVPNNPTSPATGTIVALESDAQLQYVSTPAVTNLAITDHATNYIFSDWNYGVPIFRSTTNSIEVVGLARIVTWVVSREGNKLWIVDNREYNVDSINKSNDRYIKRETFTPELGGLILSSPTDRNIAVSAGVFWYGLTTQIAPSFDTSVSDTFTYASTANNGSSWTYTTGNTQVSNTQYDDVATGLASLSVGSYGVFWVYEMIDNPTTLMVLYGQGNYTKAQAFSSQEPTIKPAILTGGGVLIGRVIVLQGATGFQDVTSSYVKQFPNLRPTLDSLDDVSVASPALNDTVTYNGTSWINSPVSPVVTSAGAGIPFFKATPNIIPTGAENDLALGTLSEIPITTTEQTISGTVLVNNVPLAFSSRVGDQPVGRTSIPTGTWYFSLYAAIDNLGGTTTVTEQIYKVTPALVGNITASGTGTTRTITASSGTPFATTLIDASATSTTASYLRTPTGMYQISARTSDTVVTIITPTGFVNANNTAVTFSVFKKLFGVTSPDFTQLAVSLLPIPASTQPAFIVAPTDYIGTIDFVTSTANPRTVSVYYNGTTHNSNMSAPLIVQHNSLPGLQGGAANEDYHLTSAEYTGVGTGVFARSTTPTFTTSLIAPLLIGGAGTTSALTYKTTTGVGATGADHIFQVGNNGATEAMRILNDGKVGIGNAAPAYPLDVMGTIVSRDSGSGKGSYLSSTWNGSSPVLNIGRTDNGGVLTIDTPTSFAFQKGAMFNGNLMVGGGGGIAANGVGDLPISSGGAASLKFNTSATERMRIDAAGNVGIGIAAPTSKLHVVDSGSWLTFDATNHLTFHQAGGGGDWTAGFKATGGNIIQVLNNGVLQASGVQGLGSDLALTSGGNWTTKIDTKNMSQSTGQNVGTKFIPTVNTSGTASVSVVQISPYITATGSGTNLLLDVGTNSAIVGTGTHTSKFVVTSAGSVGVGIAAPNANAILDLTSTTKAFMPPRMTTTEKLAIATPTAGMVVYDNTLNALSTYNGVSWIGSTMIAVATKTANYSILSTDSFIRADATSGAIAITLPTAVGRTGVVFHIKKIDASVNAVTVNTTSSETIDGLLTNILADQYKNLMVISNGTNWDIL